MILIEILIMPAILSIYILVVIILGKSQITGNKKYSKIIVHNNLFSMFNYRFLDGTSLDYKKLRFIIGTVPENKIIIKKIKLMEILFYGTIGIMIFIFLFWIVFYFMPLIKDKNIQIKIVDIELNKISIGIYLIICSLLIVQLWKNEINMGIDNYNLNLIEFSNKEKIDIIV
jgi:hypothetical protein